MCFAVVFGSVLLAGCSSEKRRVDHGDSLLSTPETQPGSTYDLEIYVVARGDTLAKISKQFQTPIVELLALNPGLQPTRLKVGQNLRVYEGLKPQGLKAN